MIGYSTVITIKRSPAEVLSALLDGPRYEQWTEMVDSRFEGEGEPRVGTKGRFRFAKGPLKGDYEMEIVRLEKDRALDIRVSGQRLAWNSNISLRPVEEGTEMTYAGDVRLLGWRRLLEPLMKGELRKGEALEAERLKKLLEEQ